MNTVIPVLVYAVIYKILRMLNYTKRLNTNLLS